MITKQYPNISKVFIYRGHEKNFFFGPYSDMISKRVSLFNYLNKYRISEHKKPWTVQTVPGEEMIDTLSKINPKETLLVITAGQSTRLDQVFSDAETQFMTDFIKEGGLGYFNCGSAYWASKNRVYNDICEMSPDKRKTIEKVSKIPLFQGKAIGPLCPFPGTEYKVGFYSDAIEVKGQHSNCTIFLGGGGSFVLPIDKKVTQKVKVLVRYSHHELSRHGIEQKDFPFWENAVIMASVDKGAILMSMFHSYYDSSDIDVAKYEKTFPQCGTNWKRIKEKLTPFEPRMRFVYQEMLSKLESRALD